MREEWLKHTVYFFFFCSRDKCVQSSWIGILMEIHDVIPYWSLEKPLVWWDPLDIKIARNRSRTGGCPWSAFVNAGACTLCNEGMSCTRARCLCCCFCFLLVYTCYRYIRKSFQLNRPPPPPTIFIRLTDSVCRT